MENKIINKIKSIILNNKQYLIYHFRWQVSAWVMLPFMLLLQAYFPLWANLMIGQFIGALIFWFVDKRIFGHHNKDSLEEEISKEVEKVIKPISKEILETPVPDVSNRKL